MNNSYYNPNLNGTMFNNPTGSTGAPIFNKGSDLPMEDSYVENILRMNKGKVASFYMTFPDANQWKDEIFTGVIEQAARDHFVISDPTTGKFYILLSIYLDYVVFDEEIEYKVV